MAIIKSSSLPQDNTIELPNAYYRIDEIYGTKILISMKVNIYTSQLNKDIGKQIDSKSYNFIPSVDDNSFNFIKQGYEFLATLPEYNGGLNDADNTIIQSIPDPIIIEEPLPKEEPPLEEDPPQDPPQEEPPP